MRIDLESQPLPNREAAIEWKEKYEQAYSPLAYSTSLTVRDNQDGTWTVHGHRYNSAD